MIVSETRHYISVNAGQREIINNKYTKFIFIRHCGSKHINMTDFEIVKKNFEERFKIPYKTLDELGGLFKTEKEYTTYMKKVLYFTKAVIEPLEKKGMKKDDAIIDIASGDGEMSVALAILGYQNLTLFDMDVSRLDFGVKFINLYSPGLKVKRETGSATEFNGIYDVLISYQTIEHLSDEGNYSIAKKKCQLQFLERINGHVKKLCFFNAPNRTFPIDGHDTGLPFFHRLPIKIKSYLIGKGIVKCSWGGICRPVTVSFLSSHLSNFSLASKYYAFDSMDEYMKNYPPFDYMGNRIPSYNAERMSFKKKLINGLSKVLGSNMQKLLPVLSVIYVNKSSRA